MEALKILMSGTLTWPLAFPRALQVSGVKLLTCLHEQCLDINYVHFFQKQLFSL